MARTIKVYSTTTNSLKTHSFVGRTWGDLCSELGLSGNVQGTGRTTRTTYNRADSIISDQDEYIFVSPTKMSSGANLSPEMREFLREKRADMINQVNELFNDLEEEVHSEIDDHRTGDGVEGENCEECEDLGEEAENLNLQ